MDWDGREECGAFSGRELPTSAAAATKVEGAEIRKMNSE
jgi:hypothetical protein